MKLYFSHRDTGSYQTAQDITCNKGTPPMAVAKTAVSALQEFCSKKKLTLPEYVIISDEELGFICKVKVMDFEETGSGRSKRDAKHKAANVALKRLKSTGKLEVEPNDTAMIVDINEMPMPSKDMVMALRDYCVQNEHPLPKFELVAQFGTPNAPRFTMRCQLASIIRYGTSDKKKDAKQRAAMDMLEAIKDSGHNIECEMEVVSLQAKTESEDEERYRLFKTYRELVDSGENTDTFGVRLDERHDFFTRFHTDLKNAAQAILIETYESEKTKAFEVLEALKITPKVNRIPSVSGKEMFFIELDCKGLDACFAGFEDDIYQRINNYFQIMLV